MSLATLSSKGQITIPAEIRSFLQIQPGDRVFLSIEGGHAVLRGVPKTDVLKVSESIRARWSKPVLISDKEADSLLADHARERDRKARKKNR